MTTNNEDKKKEEEIIETIKKTKEMRLSRAKKVGHLIEAHQGFMKRELSLAPLKPPIMQLGRRGNYFETYEDVTKGVFEFKHSSGDKRYIIIDPSRQVTFGAGKHSIKGYWAHEDHPVTGWPDPVISTEQMNIHTEKLMNDIRNWIAKSKEATGMMFLYIGAGVALVIIAVMLLKQGSPPPGTVVHITQQVVNETVNQTVQGVMGIINNTPPI